MPQHSKINSNSVITIFILVTLSVTCQISSAQEHVGSLVVRYPGSQIVQTFLQGPYSSKSRCESLMQTTWDNHHKACGTCWVDDKSCVPAVDVPHDYSKALRKEKATYPYLIATPKGRIIISGISIKQAIEMCRQNEKNFRLNGYGDARCVLP